METVLPRASVLVADPDLDAGALYAFSLRIPEKQVTQAFDGRDALMKTLSGDVSLLITETRVPLIDGYSLCEILRHDSVTRQLPILVVTADARADALARSIDAGADGVIVKPFEPAVLLAEAQRILGRSRYLRGRASKLLVTVAGQRARAELARQRSIARRLTRMSEGVGFETTNPPMPPPTLHCPSCDRMLVYASSRIGSVSETFAEQWDYYACPGACGRFHYCHRTRQLQAVPSGGRRSV